LGLLGRNGAGKTTTIQMLLGTLTPTKGEIVYFGKNMKLHRSDIMEKVNFSSTYIELPWYFSVKECLYFLSFLYKIQDRKKRIQKIVDIFKLQSLYHKKIRELSAGQKTRVNLAKAFLNMPKVLLLDEPTASLDPETSHMIRKFLLKEQEDFSLSIIFTSHNMAEVEEMCDRVIFIDHGKIIANDTPQTLAKSIGICRMELLVDNFVNIQAFCESHNLGYEIQGNYITLKIKEEEISQILQLLSHEQINYQEISIEKPSLEDYFFKAGKEENYEAL